MTAFECTSYDLGPISLQPIPAEDADKLGDALAAIPPWSVIGYEGRQMANALKREEPSVKQFEVLAGTALAGVIVIQDPFMHGPYLKLLAVLPDFQGRHLGESLLQWMESEARKAKARQLWVCVSTFNTRARAFYERFGFEAVATIDKLATDSSDEIFMRKRLSHS